MALATGLLEGQPGGDGPSYYGDDWCSSARAGLSVGRYWTPNLKTEVEVMTSTEAMQYAQRMVTQADGGPWPYGAQEYFRSSQGSARVVWQMLENRWIHPYVLAGVTVDADRQRAFVSEQYRYLGDGRTPGMRVRLVPQHTEEPVTVHREHGGARDTREAHANGQRDSWFWSRFLERRQRCVRLQSV